MTRQGTRNSYFIVLFLFLLLAISSCSQNEIWDKENSVYSNYTYKFGMRFFDPGQWDKTTANTEHTVVRFDHKSKGVMFTVNIIPVEDKSDNVSIWEVFHVYRDILLRQVGHIHNELGHNVIKYDCFKSEFLGKESITSFIIYDIKADKYKKQMRILMISETFIRDGNTYTVMSKGLFSEKEDFNFVSKAMSCFLFLP